MVCGAKVTRGASKEDRDLVSLGTLQIVTCKVRVEHPLFGGFEQELDLDANDPETISHGSELEVLVDPKRRRAVLGV
jgi:hypothetical protein